MFRATARLCAFCLALSVALPALAGPNLGGTLIVHDPALAYTSEPGEYCGLSPLSSCQEAVARIDGSGPENVRVWKVYAAFPEGSAPRLAGITWGVEYPDNLILGGGGSGGAGFGMCGDFELPDGAWPASGSGNSVVWFEAQTSLLTEIYWFSGYIISGIGVFALGPNPEQGGYFGDDAIPSQLDPIQAYGRLGFDTEGVNVCPQIVGACCFAGGGCLILPLADCLGQGGEFLGDGTTCLPNPCPGAGACCEGEQCTVLPEDECAGDWLGPDTECSWYTCSYGACCHLEVPCACEITRPGDCVGNWYGPNSVCDPNPCPQSGACCAYDGSCSLRCGGQCAGQWLGPGTDCDPNPCPQLGACCAADGSCTMTPQSFCEGTWLGPGVDCDPNPCSPDPYGACCYPDYHCEYTIQSECPTGDWRMGVPCDPNPCQPGGVDGACCLCGACWISSEWGCAGQWMGPGTDCDPNPCPAPAGRLAVGSTEIKPPSPPGPHHAMTLLDRLIDSERRSREGGETVGDATMIPGLPFTDDGATCGHINDYDEVCPYTGSTSPDVVYSFIPGGDLVLDLDLCASSYDTKLYVYDGSVGNLVACNDDAGCGYSGWQSKLDCVPFHGGHTYFIVIDGYGGDCGAYIFSILAYEPCVVECPPGAVISAEPPCGDNYVDHYNGGCSSTPAVFEPLPAQSGGCATLCGRCCTYLYQGLSYRDTDWIEVVGMGGTVTSHVTAEFPVAFFFIYGTNCSNLQYDYATGSVCQPVSLSHFVEAGAPAWLVVAPQAFFGVPSSRYVLGACGISGGPAVPVERMSWGKLKSLYR